MTGGSLSAAPCRVVVISVTVHSSISIISKGPSTQISGLGTKNRSENKFLDAEALLLSYSWTV